MGILLFALKENQIENYKKNKQSNFYMNLIIKTPESHFKSGEGWNVEKGERAQKDIKYIVNINKKLTPIFLS